MPGLLPVARATDPGEEQYEDEGDEWEGAGEGTCYICRGGGGEIKGEEGCVKRTESVKAVANAVTIPLTRIYL